MHRPILGANIIHHTKHQRMRIVSNIALKEFGHGHTIVDDYCHMFEAINGHERFVIVVLKMKQRLLNYILGERRPDSKGSQVSSTGTKRAVPKQRGRWDPWNNESKRHFKNYSRVFF
jgi:hypothetical protein